VATPRFVQKQYTLQVAMVLNTGVNRATGQNPVVAVNYDEDGVETVALNRSDSVLSPLEPDDRRVMGSVVVRWWWGLGGVRGVQLRTAILGHQCFLCSMFDVRCSMFDVRCSMFDVRCSMFDVRWALVSYLLSLVSGLLSLVFCLLSLVSCLSSLVSSLLSLVPCLLSLVSCLLHR
jgi:hypothetical protein